MRQWGNKTRRILVYLLYAISLAILQTILPPGLAFWGARPDLTLILAVLTGYLYGLKDGILVGLLAGFMRDMLAGRSLGLGMLLCMYAAILSWGMFRGHFRRNVFVGLAQTGLITILYQLIIAVLSWLLPMLPDQIPGFWHVLQLFALNLPAQLLINILAAIPLLFLLRYAGPYDRNNNRDDMEATLTGDGSW